MRGDRALVTGIAAAVFVVFAASAVLLASSLVAQVALVVAGAAMSAGSWMLLTSLNMPSHVSAIDLEAIEGADPALKESAEAVNDVAARIEGACAADEPRGIAVEAERLRAVVGSMAELVELPEFTTAGAEEDRRLVLSLATSWLPGAWDQLLTNVRYLGFGGRASARARSNVSALDGQCADVAGALDLVRARIVEGASTQIETGSDYLRQRLGRRPSELSLEEPHDGRSSSQEN